MKTFPVTIYDLKWFHFCRVIGILTGISLVAGVTYFSIHYGFVTLTKEGEWMPLLVLMSFGLFGLLLLIPLKVIKKIKALRIVFSLLGIFIVFRASFGALYIYKEIETLEKITSLLIFAVATLMIAWHLFTLNRRSDPDGVVNECASHTRD